MSWYVLAATGDVFEATGVEKWGLDREIQLEQAAAKAGLPQRYYGPFATKQEAQSYASAHPTVGSAVKAGAADLPAALNHVANTLVKLEVRVIEAVVGIVLLAIAANVILKKLTGVDVAGSAMRTGERVAGGAAAAAVA